MFLSFRKACELQHNTALSKQIGWQISFRQTQRPALAALHCSFAQTRNHRGRLSYDPETVDQAHAALPDRNSAHCCLALCL